MSLFAPETRDAWRYCRESFREHRRTLAGIVLIAFLQFFLVLPLVYLISFVFDRAIPGGHVRWLLLSGAALVALTFGNASIALWIRYLTLKVTKTATQKMRLDLVQNLYRLPRSYYDMADHGRLHARIAHDSERVDVMSNALVSQFLPSALISVALGSVLVFLNWKLFVLLSFLAPFCFLVHRILRGRLKAAVNIFRKAWETYSKGTYQALRLVDLTRVQAGEAFEAARQRANIEDLRGASSSLACLETAYSMSQNFLSMLSGVVILVAGGISVISHSMSLGRLVAFYVTVGLLANNIAKVLQTIPQLIAGNESLLSVFLLLHTNQTLPYSGSRRIEFKGALALDSVVFQYTDQALLKGLTLQVPAHSIVGIMGLNGSGKSTISNLLTGFYRPLGGGVLADGLPYEQLDIPSLRRSIGVVMQDPILFSGSIRENITYGNPKATEGEVLEAAELSTAADFISYLPAGYDTRVGEDGECLSGGQRQRIAIARALLRRPQVLVLDEPSNHLDKHAVTRLMHNLKALPSCPTIILISHSLEVLQHAEKLYLLENGRLLEVEVGSVSTSLTAMETAASASGVQI